MSMDGIKPHVCAGAEAGQTLADKVGKNKSKVLMAAIAPGVLAGTIAADKWEKADENAKAGTKMALVLGTLLAGAAFFTGKANGLKGMKALTEGAKTMWKPIKEGINKTKGELKTLFANKATKIKAGSSKLFQTAKAKGAKLYGAVKEAAVKIADKAKATFSKTAAKA